MSVQTTAEELLNESKQKIKELIELLHEFTNPNTYGYNHYDQPYIRKVIDIESTLKNMYLDLD